MDVADDYDLSLHVDCVFPSASHSKILRVFFGELMPGGKERDEQPWMAYPIISNSRLNAATLRIADKKDLFPIFCCKFVIGHRQVFDPLD